MTTVDAQAVGPPMLDRTFSELGADAPPSLVGVAAQLAAADVFLIVCGEYNHSLQPGLANLLDYFRQEYRWRPSALVSYSTGAFGGVRAAMHLREMVGELGMPAIPTSFPLPNIETALDEDGHPSTPGAVRRFDRFVSEMAWYAEAFRARRQLGTPF